MPKHYKRAAKIPAVTKKDKQQDKQISKLRLNLRIHKPERNFFDIAFTGQPDYTTGSIQLLNAVTQAITDTSRVGDLIDLESIQIRLSVVKNTSALVLNTVVRAMIVWCPTASVPTLALVLQNNGAIYCPYSPQYWDQRKQFHILVDKMVQVDNLSDNFVIVKLRKSLRGKQSQYQAATTAVNYGGLYLILGSDRVFADSPAIVGYSRLIFSG